MWLARASASRGNRWVGYRRLPHRETGRARRNSNEVPAGATTDLPRSMNRIVAPTAGPVNAAPITVSAVPIAAPAAGPPNAAPIPFAAPATRRLNATPIGLTVGNPLDKN